MKKIFLLSIGIICFCAMHAQLEPFTPYPQIPEAFNYQGVARNAAGQPLANQSIKVYSKLMVPPNSVYGEIRFYVEKRTVITNSFGLFSIQIGSPGADSISGKFPTVFDFQRSGPKIVLHTDIVLPGSPALVSLGDTKLGSVPFALYAKGARPWTYSITEEIPGAIGFTISPDKDYWNLGLGTADASEKLHVVGRIRMQDGSQSNGYVMTSDANGVASWKPGAASSSPFTRNTNRTFLVNSNDSVGIGVANATAKLDVVGKLRLRDGTEFVGHNLVSDQFGVASWKKPDWTVADNNIGGGYHVIYPSDINRTVGIGTAIPDNSVKLHVNGGIRFTGNGPLVEGNVLTVGFGGNAVWTNPINNASAYWAAGSYGGLSVIQSNTTLTNTPYYSRSQFVVSKDMNVNSANDFLNRNNYPMVVENSKHGIAVVVNGAARKAAKFISFFDDGFGGRYRGAIEGQTLLELQDDPEYIAYISLQTLSTSAFVAEGIACTAQADVFEFAVQVVQAAIWGADLGLTIDRLESNVGVAYSSGAGDYAEWLEKADPAEKFYFGDIVSVNGGKISKKITGGGQLMVISRAPIVLGNMPEEGKTNNFEKVAFMGQVPVKVTGTVAVGDYIVAFANGSGLGYAVNPAKITPEEMNRIAGVAWSASGNEQISIINTAVGVNTQAVNQIVKKQDDEISLLKNTVNELSAYLQAKDASFKYAKLDTKPAVSTMALPPATEYITTGFTKLPAQEQLKKINKVSVERVKKLISGQPQYIDAVMKQVIEKIQASGQDINNNPQVKKLLTDKAFMIETIRKAYNIS